MSQDLQESPDAADNEDEGSVGITSTTKITSSTEWRAPLPPPGVLREYESIIPGSADRLFKTYEEQASHRRRLEELTVRQDGRIRTMGMVLAYSIGSLLISAALVALFLGHPWVAVSIVGGTLVAAMSVFIKGSRTGNGSR